MKSIFRVLAYIKNYKKDVFLNILFNILYVFFNLFSIVMVVPFASVLFGIVESPDTLPTLSLNKDAIVGYASWYIVYYKQIYGFFPTLIYICVLFIILTFLSNLCRYMTFYFLAPIRNGVLKDLRRDIYRKITILPVGFFTLQRRGDIISRLTTDVSNIEWCVMATFLQMVVKDPIMIIVFTFALFFCSWKFALLLFILLPLPIFLINKISGSLGRNSLRAQEKTGALLSFAEEALSMSKVTKSLNAESTLEKRFKIFNTSYTKSLFRIVARVELAAPLTEYFAIIILAIIVILGGIFVIKGNMHPAILIAFTVLFTRLIPPVKELITAYYNLKKGDSSAKRIYEILDAQEKVREKPSAVKIKSFCDNIKFDHVGFRYDNGGDFALRDINFTIKKGEKVAIVGASGAGKSTLFDLFARFADVTQGKILIDGHDIKEYNIDSLRSLFGVVTQENILFNDSVKNNIAFGNENASEDDIIQSARTACADEFINHLPKGYDTIVGDRAMSLSGGERQRLCIARAILNNPPILLMDEATSAMDTENEHQVSMALRENMRDKTLIVIAHRLSTITDSDKIIVMDKGEIVECGKHEELLQKKGYYSQLIKMQSI